MIIAAMSNALSARIRFYVRPDSGLLRLRSRDLSSSGPRSDFWSGSALSVRASAEKVDYIILGFANVDGLDAAAHFALRKLNTFAKAEHICLLFSSLTSDNAKALQAANVIDKEQSVCFASTAMAVEYVENRLLKPFGTTQDSLSAEDALAAVIGERDKALVLLPYFTLHDIKAGDQLFREGEDADGSILLVRGNLSAHLDLGGGQSVRLRKFLPGTLMGEMAFYSWQ